MVAPLLKQVFSPRTGACLDQEGLGMTVYERASWRLTPK